MSLFSGIYRSSRFLAPIGLLLAVSVPSRAAGVSIGRQVFASHTVIVVNNVPVAGLANGSAYSGVERASRVESRLSGWASMGRDPQFAVFPVNGEWSVLANGGVVMTPSHEDAVRAGLARRQLAHAWAARLKSAWATPFLRLSEDGVVVGVGAARSLRVLGAARGPVRVEVDANQSLSAREIRPGVIQLIGLSPGRGSVTVTRDGASVTSAFLVMKTAGEVRPINIEVTGTAIPGDLLEDVVDAEMRRSIRLEAGAWFTTKTRPRFPDVWTRGDRLTYTVPVRLAGPNTLAVQTTVPIRIRRRRLARPQNVTLFYSNQPETVTKPQSLFSHILPDDTAARFLYHHQNMSGGPLNMAVDLTNAGTTEVPIQIVDASAAPSMDTVLVGHQAAYKFLKRLQTGTGIIVRIPPGTRRSVFVRRLNPGDTMSGLMLFRPLVHGKVTVSMRAEDVRRGDDPGSMPDVPSETVFPSPDKTLDVSYTVGGAWAYVPIGRYPVLSANGLRLDGNYGVLYTVRLSLANPTAQKATVRVIFEPRAGRAQAAFVINGEITETPSIYPPSEERVMTISLEPHETKMVTIVTIPAAGGSYPAALIVRA